MRKPDEILFYNTLRKLRAITWCRADDVASILGIHVKRANYLLSKWTTRGWWDWGCTARGGWFTDSAPEVLE